MHLLRPTSPLQNRSSSPSFSRQDVTWAPCLYTCIHRYAQPREEASASARRGQIRYGTGTLLYISCLTLVVTKGPRYQQPSIPSGRFQGSSRFEAESSRGVFLSSHFGSRARWIFAPSSRVVARRIGAGRRSPTIKTSERKEKKVFFCCGRFVCSQLYCYLGGVRRVLDDHTGEAALELLLAARHRRDMCDDI